MSQLILAIIMAMIWGLLVADVIIPDAGLLAQMGLALLGGFIIGAVTNITKDRN